jgi:hypothetical protein
MKSGSESEREKKMTEKLERDRNTSPLAIGGLFYLAHFYTTWIFLGGLKNVSNGNISDKICFCNSTGTGAFLLKKIFRGVDFWVPPGSFCWTKTPTSCSVEKIVRSFFVFWDH